MAKVFFLRNHKVPPTMGYAPHTAADVLLREYIYISYSVSDIPPLSHMQFFTQGSRNFNNAKSCASRRSGTAHRHRTRGELCPLTLFACVAAGVQPHSLCGHACNGLWSATSRRQSHIRPYRAGSLTQSQVERVGGRGGGLRHVSRK